jgi:arylsulfate sulfotransferase
MNPFVTKTLIILSALLVLTTGLSHQAEAAITVQLTASPASPRPVGTTITFTAAATDSDPGVISYRFSVGSSIGPLLVSRDFSTLNTFLMTPARYNGLARVQVTAQNNSTHATAQATLYHLFTSRVRQGGPTVNRTANPLVALFSAPACPLGSEMRVRFRRKGTVAVPDATGWLPCVPSSSMNFYVAGMRANSGYKMYAETFDGAHYSSGPTIRFRTGTPSVSFPAVTFPVPPTTQDSLAEHVLLVSDLTGGTFPAAFDLSGYPIWYYRDPMLVSSTPLITRPVEGGTILLVTTGTDENGATGPNKTLREIDLAGNILRETNTVRVAEQLVAMGGTSSCQTGSTQCLVGAFHHDAIRLPNGHTLVMADEEKIFTDGTQGSSPDTPVDLIGDMIIDLDLNWQVSWYWSAFDHLDVNRAAVLGETCQPNQGGCPTLYLASLANDWLHGNAIDYASDGSLLLSMRHQDWIVKIDYHDGAGTGDVLWTLGEGGDFTIDSTDTYPWFSHQHDVGFEQNGTTILSMFDNGNTRHSIFSTANSRGYVLNIDQTNMTVTPILLSDLGVYSPALGSASRLLNGNYHFLAGTVQPGPFNQSIEVLPNGTIGLAAQITGAAAYRSFRMLNLYTPPNK